MLAGRGLLRRFAGDRRGTTGIIFALTTLVVIGIMGMGIDLGRGMVTAHRMQAALDNALLAAAAVDAEEREAVAGRFFAANFQNGGSVPVGAAMTRFTATASGGITGTAELSVATTFMQIFRIDRLDLVTRGSVGPGARAYRTAIATPAVTGTTVGSLAK